MSAHDAFAVTATPVAPGLFVWPVAGGEACLLASRCPECGDVAFPALEHCRMPDCSMVDTESVEIAGTGRVLASTVEHYPPPGPFGAQPFHPITIALVEFPQHGLAVLGQVWGVSGERPVATGSPARLVLDTLYPGSKGDVVGWGFRLEDRP
jgi:uncharacterized OB-fold protein